MASICGNHRDRSHSEVHLVLRLSLRVCQVADILISSCFHLRKVGSFTLSVRVVKPAYSLVL